MTIFPLLAALLPALALAATPQWNLSSALNFHYPDIPVAWNLRDVLLYAVSIGAQVANQTLVDDPNFAVFPSYATALSFKGTSYSFSASIPDLPYLDVFQEPARAGLILPRAVTMVQSLAFRIFQIPSQFNRLSERDKKVQDSQYIEPYLPLPNDSGPVPWTIKKRIISVEERVNPSSLIIGNELVLFNPKGVKYTRLIATTKYFGGTANGFNFSASIAVGIKPKPVPSRAPDLQIRIPVSPIETLIYRLNGDYNALHVDPSVGLKFGYGGLVLHALSYFGFSAFQLVGHLGGGDVASLHSMQGAFGLPISPGDDLLLKAWEVGHGPHRTKEITFVVEDLTKKTIVLDRAAAFIRRK
ncbi:uncharacterized protein EI90DRAFT_3127951 [Cantharellus anzutake]|uniref:uncharacterized protein n=1 Tax=Cantharellus anzutake TaxID=1750568 RepID=UPI0019036CF4|nr:uncharacterized protein EI90DRAFT_3127951 [Cantharellus anzutake]KAF8326358.1 hypothetical protein EI90DRAFT_3127951 [Cantharellus anzutake]